MRVTLVHDDSGDWMGVYIDGALRYQGHSIEDSKLLELVGVDHTYVTSYISSVGESHLPDALEDVPTSKPCVHELPEHGFLQGGDKARCAKCGIEFTRIDDEAEGGYWLDQYGGQAV